MALVVLGSLLRIWAHDSSLELNLGGHEESVWYWQWWLKYSSRFTPQGVCWEEEEFEGVCKHQGIRKEEGKIICLPIFLRVQESLLINLFIWKAVEASLVSLATLTTGKALKAWIIIKKYRTGCMPLNRILRLFLVFCMYPPFQNCLAGSPIIFCRAKVIHFVERRKGPQVGRFFGTWPPFSNSQECLLPGTLLLLISMCSSSISDDTERPKEATLCSLVIWFICLWASLCSWQLTIVYFDHGSFTFPAIEVFMPEAWTRAQLARCSCWQCKWVFGDDKPIQRGLISFYSSVLKKKIPCLPGTLHNILSFVRNFHSRFMYLYIFPPDFSSQFLPRSLGFLNASRD